MDWWIWITWWVYVRYSGLFCVYCKKKHNENIDNPSIKIYVNKIENRTTFKIKTGCYLELLTPEKMKLLGSIENKITKDKNGKSAPHLEITEWLTMINNDYREDSRVLYNQLVVY